MLTVTTSLGLLLDRLRFRTCHIGSMLGDIFLVDNGLASSDKASKGADMSLWERLNTRM